MYPYVGVCAIVVNFWYSLGVIYTFGVGFSEVARFDDGGQFSGASGCEASDEQGFTSFFICIVEYILC